MPHPAEERVLEIAADFAGDRILGVTIARAAALAELATARPSARVVGWLRDQYRASLVSDGPDNLQIVCAADPPDDQIDLAVLPSSMRGEAELTRETLQEALHRLRIGGVLVAASDNPRDAWLRQQMDALLPGVRLHRFADAVVYSATKKQPLRKRRDFSCEFPYRDGDRLLKAVTRPGVFAHRRVDPGARQLLAAAVVGAGERVLEIGCGAGTVALALAAREPTAHVHAVDSDARAVECTERGVALNGLANVTVELNAFGDYRDAGVYDLAVTNPPYYADNQIAARMLDAAHESLRPGGQLLAVTKTPAWYETQLATIAWRGVRFTESKRYWIVAATRP
ncbi:Ribosomal RNA small subunit methyltransferase C [Botrimarina colliarenosi]|uniref:Ribosomal RNA small subunit methyltransferase C n=1 Tax=Botrimarina colliarenosi TaxID=2528001 RepID=A0A5C6AGD6_9BACT|nr:methyltransferase [Botrimarina colliarenosi]TWT98121.1 Ribosomal RNA small subunit methyltransferase C [Botrimarina colliarenosi]